MGSPSITSGRQRLLAFLLVAIGMIACCLAGMRIAALSVVEGRVLSFVANVYAVLVFGAMPLATVTALVGGDGATEWCGVGLFVGIVFGTTAMALQVTSGLAVFIGACFPFGPTVFAFAAAGGFLRMLWVRITLARCGGGAVVFSILGTCLYYALFSGLR